jgi:MarR family transcriptional regulator, transcriptional regulator for hemolysin
MNSPDPRQTPSFLIKLAAQELMRRGEERLRPLGLGFAYLPVLVALKNGEASTQADLARLLHVEQPSMAQMLTRMERDGLIRRRPDAAHKRSRIVELTAMAFDRLPQARAALNEDNRKAMAGFTTNERKTFVSLLERVNANLRDAAS